MGFVSWVVVGVCIGVAVGALLKIFGNKNGNKK